MTTVLEARFLAVISHELRTPLTTIASFTESLTGDDLAPDERSQALSAVRRSTERMLTLVDDLMVVSRLQAGDLTPSPDPVDVLALVAEAADLLATREAPATAILTLGEAPSVCGDASMLLELFYAVLGTVTTGASDGSAKVSTSAGPVDWTMTVVGRRSGRLTDEHLMAGSLADLQPPHRRRSAALWMLLADAIATRHGGSVELTFDPEIGAGATIRLPLSITSSMTADPR